MLSKVRTALHQAVEEMVKEFYSSYEETKRYNESLRNDNHFLMKRIKELNERCNALQAEKDCSAVREENTRLLGQVAQQKDENEVLHRKINDLVNKLSQAQRERDELKEKLHYLRSFLIDPSKVTDLQKKNAELVEQLKNKAILDSVLARKYEKLQIALNSDIGETFECEIDGLPFEKGYYLRISKKSYELVQSNRATIHIVVNEVL